MSIPGPNMVITLLIWLAGATCASTFVPSPAFSAPGTQIPTIPVTLHSSGTSVNPMAVADTTALLPGPDHAWERLKQSKAAGDDFYGFTQDFVLMGFSLANQSDYGSWYLEVRNPHINSIRLYTRTSTQAGYSEWAEAVLTGRTTPFSTRPVPHFNFVFDLDLAQEAKVDILLIFDKRRSSIYYPVRLWSMKHFSAVQQRHYAYFGLYFGIFGLIVLISLVAFLFSFQRIYFWYFFYVLSVGLFVFVDIGLAHQYIYPESGTIGGASRIGLSYLLVFTFNMFTMSYFRTSKNYPVVHRLFLTLCATVAAIAFSHTFFTEWTQQNATYVLYLLYLVIIASITLALWVAFRYIRFERNTAILFILAFSFIFIAGIIFILGEFGLISIPDLLFTPIQIGSVMEIIFLSFGLAWQVRFVEKKQIKLTEKVHRLENEKLNAYIQGTEKERSRVAAELHDAIGSKLGQLRRNMEAGHNGLPQTTRQIKDIIDDVRIISHKLSPPSLVLTGLAPQIERLVLETDQTSRVTYSYQAVDVPENLPDDLTRQVFRIVQEGIENIEKHSAAEKAEIQLICHRDQLVLTLEDNGKGFDTTDASKNGIGLSNIKKRVAYLKGEVMITSAVGRGTGLMLTIPLPQERPA